MEEEEEDIRMKRLEMEQVREERVKEEEYQQEEQVEQQEQEGSKVQEEIYGKDRTCLLTKRWASSLYR